jgi:hypothetical protein
MIVQKSLHFKEAVEKLRVEMMNLIEKELKEIVFKVISKILINNIALCVSRKSVK